MHDRIERIEDLAGTAASELTRHSHPMLLLDELVEASSSHAVCTWRAPSTCPIRGGEFGVPAYVSIECMAQCIAVLAGARARMKGQQPPLGLLLGTRHFSTRKSHLQTGIVYRVTCRELVRNSEGLASFKCTFAEAGGTISSCQLAVFESQPGEILNESDS